MMSMSAASAALAAGAAPAFFAELVALLVIGALVAYVCHRLGLVPIVGFLLAGVVIGPSVLGLIDDRAQIDALAELGVILVLFTIGVEFSLERLARIKTLIFGGGGLQVGLTTVAVCALLMPLGVSWQIGVFTGFLVALSSTAIVLKLLGDNYEGSEETSRVALGLLIFQDLAIVLMVLLVPMLGGAAGDTTSVAMALLRAVLVIVAVLVVARRLLPPLLERVARTCSPELFLMSIVAICFGTAYLTSLAGVSLSLGAFLAGLMVSESRFSLHALTEVMPLQILFSAAFFISVGMLLDLGFVARNLLLVMAVVLGMTVLKIAIAALSVRLLGYGWPTAIASAFTLGQIGEFSFVLAKAGEAVALFPAGRGDIGSQTFIAAAVLSMMATPGMARLGNHLGAWLDRRRASASTDIVPAGSADASDDLHGHGPSMKGHVIIAGYGTLARRLASALEAANVDFLITTLNPDGARDAEAHGWRVLRGDAGRAAFLQAAGLENSATLVIPDDLPEKAHTVVSVARGIAPHVRIVVWTPAAANADEMHDHGADRVVNDQDATADALLSAVLRGLGRRGLDLEALLAYGQDDMPALERPIDVRKPVRMLVDPNSMAARKSKHLGAIREVYPMAPGCVECLRHGNTDWVHLRICMTTGYVGCCDASHGHMRQHYERTGHPIMRSLEPGEDWGWSYPEEMMIPALPDPNAPAVDAEVEIEAEAEADRA